MCDLYCRTFGPKLSTELQCVLSNDRRAGCQHAILRQDHWRMQAGGVSSWVLEGRLLSGVSHKLP
ncbi:hypothetical protein DPMN_038682 [Dreissena polymorpha]|uniref:Uncharacterized protein n=1 Tax=Dreissena polymorpha TaxID=45954 RepID=A0A9D4RNF9_DREPO|nr:hypothetical protein DPMN_038682 [Dreissena polymorpha]